MRAARTLSHSLLVGGVLAFSVDASAHSPYQNRPQVVLQLDHQDARFGTTVRRLGDVNGDGYEDVAVGAPWYSDTQREEGVVAVYYGSSNGLSSTPDWIGHDAMGWAHSGWSIAGGDVNADGFDDLVIGAPHAQIDGKANSGSIYVYFGSPNGLETTYAWTYSSNAQSWFGASVAVLHHPSGAAGEVAVGAPMDFDSAGQTCLFTDPAHAPTSASVVCVEGSHAGARLGQWVASVDDLDADGRARLAYADGWGTMFFTDDAAHPTAWPAANGLTLSGLARWAGAHPSTANVRETPGGPPVPWPLACRWPAPTPRPPTPARSPSLG